VEGFCHILPVFDVRCESRTCRGVEILLRRALSTWKALVDAVNGDADECDEHWSTRYIGTALNLFSYLSARSVG